MSPGRYSSLVFIGLLLPWCDPVIPAIEVRDVSDFCISIEPAPSQFVQNTPRLFPAPDGGFIMAWEDCRLGEPSYFAQRFDSCGTPEGDNFQVVGYEDMTFLPDGMGMIIGATTESGLWPERDAYVVYGQLLPASNPPTEPFVIDGGTFPDCAVGFWGLGAKVVAASDHFLFGFNFGGSISLKKFDLQGRMILDFENRILLPQTAASFSLAVNSRNQYVLLWFNAYPEEVASGLYATFFSAADSIVADSVLVEAYPPTHYWSEEWAPRLRAVAVSDTAFQFFWADADSLSLKYVTYSPSGRVFRAEETIALPSGPPETTSWEIYNFSLTNPRFGGFGVLTSVRHWHVGVDTDVWSTCRTSVNWFDLNGRLTVSTGADSSQFPVLGDQLARLSLEVLACPVESYGDVFLSRLQDFTWLDSLRVNDDIQGASQTSPRVVARDAQTFFVNWQDEGGCHGRSIDLEGNLLGEEVLLDGREVHFFLTGKAVNFWNRQIDERVVLAGMTIYDSRTWQPVLRDTLARALAFWGGASVTGLPISDSSLVVLEQVEEELYLASYSLGGQCIKKRVVARPFNVGTGLIPNMAQSFWVLLGGSVQLHSNDLEPLSSTFNLGLSTPLLYVGQGRFLMTTTSYPPPGVFATIIDTTGAQVQQFLLVDDPHATNMALTLLDSTRFLALWTLHKEVYARTFTLAGQQVTDLLAIHDDVEAHRDWVDACVNDGKVLFVWTDTRNWEQGYDIYGSMHDLSEITYVAENDKQAGGPSDFLLAPNYPNPFNETTLIRYHLPKAGYVTVEIWDLLGRKVRALSTGCKQAGTHTTRWDSRDSEGSLLPAGIYFARLRMGERVAVRKLSLLR